MTLSLYGGHLSRFQTKTIEQSRRQRDYLNWEFSRFVRLTLVQYAWTIFVCVTLERQKNNGVPVFTGPFIALAESVVGNEGVYVLLPCLQEAKAKDAIVAMMKGLVCDQGRFPPRKFHLCSKTTTIVLVANLPSIRHLSILEAHV